MATRREFDIEPTGEPMREPMREPMGEETGTRMERTVETAKEKAEGLGNRIKSRAKDMMEGGKQRAASGIDRVGQRLEDRAESMEMEGGLKGRAAKVVHKAGDALEDSADYLETHEIGTISDDVTSRIRAHPYMSVGLALGTGFLLGRAFGGGEEEEERQPEWREREEMRMPRMEAGQHRRGPGLRKQLGHALMSGVSAMVSKQVRQRASRASGC